MNIPQKEIDILKWQCRRGMLELDLILNNFLEKYYAQLSELLKQDFKELLTYNDQALFNILILKNKNNIANIKLAKIIDLILNTAFDFRK